jgi:hypothetical protein
MLLQSIVCVTGAGAFGGTPFERKKAEVQKNACAKHGAEPQRPVHLGMMAGFAFRYNFSYHGVA